MSTIDIKVPPLGESVTTAIIARWYKKVGEAVHENEIILELETDKVTLEVNAATSGVLQQISAFEGETVAIGDIVGVIAEGEVAEPAQSLKESSFTKALALELADDPKPVEAKTEPVQAPETKNKTIKPTENPSKEVIASPAARKLMAEEKLTPLDVKGTGKDGRIMKEDVLLRNERADVTPLGATSALDASERKLMTPLRKKIAERLKYAQNTAAILTTFNECDMSTVMNLRKIHQDEFVKKYGTKLGFMSFFVKACVQALKDVPAVNGEIDGDYLVHHKRYDIGIAVSAPQGLVVPVLRDADRLGLHNIEQAIANYGEKAKANKLSMQDLTGGTFTISNGGIFGSLLSTPILNPPQSGILGMHKIQDRPVVINGQVVIRPMMYLALSYDHRMIDGREAVTFLVKVKEYIENPARILLGL